MLFNSIDFALFLPLVFVAYWFCLSKKVQYQNIVIVIASYIFYGWWDYRFLSLILFSTLVDYFIGLRMKNLKLKSKKKKLLYLSLIVNLGLLGFFKYYNFFIENFLEAFSIFGNQINPQTLNIILPVGISFYTFQTLSYSIDVYRGKLEPTRDLFSFLAFVSFFPQLVAGPIERATNLLPQFYQKREFNYTLAYDGLKFIIWGLFKKLVVADSCAQYVNVIFSDYQSFDSWTLFLGVFYFAFQIYGDFSGYSDIAIGVSKLFGFNLMRNFNYPYFSRNIAEFWRKWHISLSTWFRDYLYIPLGGSRGKKILSVRNIFVIFMVSGFWHGANWTFIAWGVLNALYFIPLFVVKRNRRYVSDIDSNIVSVKEVASIIITFLLTLFAWVFFRSDTIYDAMLYLKRIFNFEVVNWWQYLSIERYSIELVPLVFCFILIEWFHKKYEHPYNSSFSSFKMVLTIFLILILGVFTDHSEFIYFQF